MSKPRVAFFLRVSTQSQEYERQELELKTYVQDKNWEHVLTIASKVSGMKKRLEREDLKQLFKAVDAGRFEKLIVTEVSRLGRNARDLRHTVEYLHDRNVSIVFKNLGGMESLNEEGSETFVSNIIMQIHIELAAEEREQTVSRIKSGLKAAKVKGKKLGRPVGTTKDDGQILTQYRYMIKDIQAGLSISKLMKLHDVSKGTVIKVRRLVRSKVADQE